MTTDDDRISFLEGLGDVDGPERAELDELKELLAHPSVWEDPSPDVEARAVAAVQAERSLDAEPDDWATPARTERVAPSTPTRRRSWLRPAIATSAVAAAAIVAFVFVSTRADDVDQLEAALTSEVFPELTATAEFTRTDSGWRIDLDAPGLPRLDDGRFYQAWLRNDDGALVTIGTFNEGDDVVLWAGVSPRDFPTITVTREADDGDHGSSGDRVLAGPIVDD